MTTISEIPGSPTPWQAIGFATAACALIAVTTLLAKMLGGAQMGEAALHPLQISAGRFVFAFLAVSIAFAALKPGLHGAEWSSHLGRASCGWLGVSCMFAAATQIPLADATAISFLSPLFTILLAVIFLKEIVRRPQIAGSGLAIIGVILLLAPGAEGFRPAAFIALAGAVFMGVESIFIKRLSDREPPVRILFLNNLIGASVAVIAASFVWRPPLVGQWAMLAMLGLTMAAAQALFIQAMKRGNASKIAPILNMTLVFATVYDFALFGEVPTVVAALGALAIVGGVLLASRR